MNANRQQEVDASGAARRAAVAADLSQSDREFADPANASAFSDEQYLSVSETEFRARFRERLHHTLEIQTYHAIHNRKSLTEARKSTVLRLLGLWDQRGLSHDLPEYVFAGTLLDFADQLIAGREVNLSAYRWRVLSESERDVFDNVVHERRSVRHWDETREVPDALIRKLLKAGLWAAHSCNLQSIRYIVTREAGRPGLFAGSDIPGGPVHIVLLQDERVYLANRNNPVRNRLLDCGAAAQNIVLAAHAHGLGGCWLTFSEGMIARLRKAFELPDPIQAITYVDVGWPVQTPVPVPRISVDEALLSPL
jgi:nitroreductase